MSELSPERLKFIELLDQFIGTLKPGCVVYDIGKSNIHDYRPLFGKFKYRTIDIDRAKNPDILMDVEEPGAAFKVHPADAIILHGVYEQCNNPIALVKGASMLLKPKGRALFGLTSVAFPLYEIDWQRITPNGVARLLKGFNLIETNIVHRNQIPSYVFVTAEKI